MSNNVEHGMQWFDWDIENETHGEWRARLLMSLPPLNAGQLEALQQLRSTVWDGNLIGKSYRDQLVTLGLACRWNGWQVITQLGMILLETLGYMQDDRWRKSQGAA